MRKYQSLAERIGILAQDINNRVSIGGGKNWEKWLIYGASSVLIMLTRLRRIFFRLPFIKVGVGSRIISVGSISAGGTGKTPVIQLIGKMAQNMPMAIINRGYGGKKGLGLVYQGNLWIKGENTEGFGNVEIGENTEEFGNVENGENTEGFGNVERAENIGSGENFKRAGFFHIDPAFCSDESVLVALSLPESWVFSNKRREKMAIKAMKLFKPPLIILDDAMQYFRLEKDLEIGVLDASKPFPPLGLCRDRASRLKGLDAIILTHCDRLEDRGAVLSKKLEKRLVVPVFPAAHKGAYLVDLWDGRKLDLSILQELKVISACGIADPESFEKTLEKLGANIVLSSKWRDHGWPGFEKLVKIMKQGALLGAEAMIVTAKDQARIFAALGAYDKEIGQDGKEWGKNIFANGAKGRWQDGEKADTGPLSRLKNGLLPFYSLHIELSLYRGEKRLKRLILGLK